MFLSEKKTKKIAALGAAFMLGASLLMTGCGGGSKTASSGGGGGKDRPLTIGLTNAPAELNPLQTPDQAGRFVVKFMFDTLMGEPEMNKFTPHLATAIETKDKQTYTIKLNPKAQWSDGKPITADDLIFTLNLAANKNVVSSLGRYINFFEGVNSSGKLVSGDKLPSLKKIDDHTVEFKAKKPLDPNIVLGSLGVQVPLVPKHVFEKLEPKAIPNAPEVVNPKVFSGPYKFVKMVTNDHVEMVANDKYVRGVPKIKRLFFRISNDTNLVVGLKAGKINVAAGHGIGKVNIKELDGLKADKKLSVEMFPGTGTQLLCVNNQVYKDVHFRRGVTYAINRQQIKDQLLKGHADLTPTIYTKANYTYDDSVKNYPYDVEKAKAELAQSGVDLSQEITLMVPIGNSLREQSADIILQNLKAAGLNVKISKMDFPTLIGHARKGDYQMLLIGLAQLADPDYSVYFAPQSLSNYQHTDDPKLMEMFDKGIQLTDANERKVVYQQIQKYITDNAFQVALYNEDLQGIKSADLVGGVKPFWDGTIDDVHTWYFK